MSPDKFIEELKAIENVQYFNKASRPLVSGLAPLDEFTRGECCAILKLKLKKLLELSDFISEEECVAIIRRLFNHYFKTTSEPSVILSNDTNQEMVVDDGVKTKKIKITKTRNRKRAIKDEEQLPPKEKVVAKKSKKASVKFSIPTVDDEDDEQEEIVNKISKPTWLLEKVPFKNSCNHEYKVENVQVRRGDEGPTQFKRCVHCGAT
ncbi:MAG: hypothetical protein ACRYGG_03130 [Janthinobacterium lividum]